MSIDPVTFLDTGEPSYFNRYRYCANDPVNCTDPTGKSDAFGTTDQILTETVAYVMAPVYDFLAADAVNAVTSASQGNFVPAAKSAGLFAVKPAKALQKANQLRKNIAQGKKGEALTQAKLGDNIAGKQVTLESSKGTKARVDFVTKDGGVVETKTGNAQLSSNQQDVFDDINAGRLVTPRGGNAAKAGLRPNEPVKLPSCSVDRAC